MILNKPFKKVPLSVSNFYFLGALPDYVIYGETETDTLDKMYPSDRASNNL